MLTTRKIRSVPRLVSLCAAVAIALAASASWVAAHDFWLVPGAFPFVAGSDVEILGQTGSRFPQSVAPLAFARVGRAVMIGADGESPITDMSHRGTSLLLRSRPTTQGQRIVAVTLVPRSTRQTGEGFLKWLRLEGAADAAGHLERAGKVPAGDSLTRTDTKYAKALVDVGSGGPRTYTRSSNQEIEFIPERDPATLRGGDTLLLQLKFKGQPLSGTAIHAGIEAPADTTIKASPDSHLTSDSRGLVRLPVSATGLWNIRTIHVLQAGPAAWETHWATLVFRAGK